MSKKQFQQSQRVMPIGEAGIAAIRNILSNGQYAKVNSVMVDRFSASAIIQVYDAINDDNKVKLRSFPVARVADISFRLINKRS